MGTFQAVYVGLRSLYYKGNTNQNTNRLRSRIYNPLASRNFPYEELVTIISVNEKCEVCTVTSLPNVIPQTCEPYKFLANRTQIMHIVDINDTPEISHPAIIYSIPFYCNKLSRLPECHFGQFFSNEDSDRTVQIGGIQIFDIDVKESCTFLTPECAKIDVSVRAARGSVALNTRARLDFYENTREAQGFTALITPSNAAVKVVFYRVELLENIGPSSVILDYNTLHSGNLEFVTVTVSDQGLSGAAGVAKVQDISINVTIVAVNDAPTITIDRLEYAMLEDTLTKIEGIAIMDIDLNEKIESSLSRLTWMKPVASQQTLNQILYSVSVIHGILRLGYQRGLRLVNVAEASFYTIQAGRFGHDTCRVNDIYNKLPELLAAAASVQGVDITTIKTYASSGLCLYANAGTPDCPTGTERFCSCFGDFTCALDGTITLYINNTAADFVKPPNALGRRAEDAVKRKAWLDVIGRAVASKDKTCGGMPVLPAPNNFSVGLECQTDDDCSANVMSACTPGRNCTCCANASHVCSTDNDCFLFNKGSPCGCVLGGPANGVCGPYCENKGLTTGCITALIGATRPPKYYGRQCSFRAPFPNPLLPGSSEPAFRECRSAAFGIEGSRSQKVLDLVGILSSGSKRVTFIGELIDVQRALANIFYITDINYNRLFRPPIQERDPLTFDIEADNVDTLSMFSDDLGNSGGMQFDPKIVAKSVNMRVAAANDNPVSNGPLEITVTEDVPFHFQAGTSSGLHVSDPDFNDFGFNLKVFTVNLTCSNGRLYLNEKFLKQSGIAGTAIAFRYWGGSQEKRGLHFEDRSGKSPIYGNDCQRQTQCSDGVGVKSPDSPYGFFKSEMYGLVYSPQTAGGLSQGCGVCPEDSGNKFISIEGTFKDVNQALSLVTYLPDPNFNTRSGRRTEEIVFEVSDNGGIGNDATAAALTDKLMINVLVESVNDRPIIGRKVKAQRTMIKYTGGNDLPQRITDTAILDLNKTLDAFCAGIPPSGDEYSVECGPGKRQYIDIDEDTEFFITPDVLWIEDVDSEESTNVEEPRRYCCNAFGPAGCRCGSPCNCDGVACRCPTPPVCKSETVTAGQLVIHMSVKHGVLKYYPPPGRDFFRVSDLVFLTNSTPGLQEDKGDDDYYASMIPCANQRECMQDVSEINIRARKTFIQTGLNQMFLTYKALPNYYGPDLLYIRVTDSGYTDECYSATLTATQTISIRVIGLNDAPVIKYDPAVMVFPRGLRCYANFHDFRQTDTGLNQECIRNPNASMIPPNMPDAMIQFTDVDVDDTPFGNMTVTIRVGNDKDAHADAGSFTLIQVNKNSQNWFDLYRDPLVGLITLQIQGKVEEMNALMVNLRYDGDATYQGYVPIRIYANDNKNFGECSGNHKCGNQDVCGDHNEAEPHRPVSFGMSDVILAATIGALAQCGSSDCNICSSLPGCGFCPGACPEFGGKCMVGTKSGPTYETCDAHPRDGRTWNQCAKSTANNLATYVIIGVVFLVSMFMSYIFVKWVRRRHGSLKIYMLRKQADLKRAGRKAQMLPPDEANYNMFFFLIAVSFIVSIVVLGLGSSRPDCNFNFKIFLDKASSIHLETDACKVKFVSSRNMSYPDNALQTMKMQLALPVEPDIVLERDTCGVAATIAILNNRDDAIKYVNYHCNIQILVPDRYVVPKTTIVARGDNITYVRAGDMDPDSYKFGLRFGPNSFNLQGNFMRARIQNLSATHFDFNVAKGELIGIQIQAITAEFMTEEADIIMTTPGMTSVKFWQKSNNLMCLTAAENSLFVDDACNEICEYKLSDSRRSWQKEADSVQVVNATHKDELRQSVLPWLCKDNGDGTQNCTRYDPVQAEIDDTCPVGAQFKKKSQVPQIVGCFDLGICSLEESARCLCKPKCDMADLDPPGTCNAFGQCCQTICAGYSKADMFPEPDMPRCGVEVNPAFMWCNGTLDQRWTFTSTSGQISMEVVDNKLKVPHRKHSSYQGSSPAPDVDVKVDLLLADKVVLNEAFHPGGGNTPQSEWFALRLKGPGAPEPADGEFVWLASVRYLVLPAWMLSFLSMGLLEPSKGASLSGLNPSFCPAFTPSTSVLFQQRLVQMRQILLDSLETFPGPDKKAIPFTSLLSYVPVGGAPRVFSTDPATNQIGVSLVNSADYPLVVAVVGLAIAIPMILATASMLTVISAAYKIVQAYRVQKLKEEQLTANLHKVFTSLAKVEEDEMHVPLEKKVEMMGRTNLFYLFEDFVLSSAEAQRSLIVQWLVVIYEVLIVVVPSTLIFLLTSLLKTAYQAQKCEFRPDVCNCFSEVDFIVQMTVLTNLLLYVLFFVSVLEMSVFYLSIPYSLFRRILRIVFYALFFFVIWLAIVILLVVVLFVLLGILVKPTHLAPYGIAIVGTVACCVAVYAKKRKFQTRVERAVSKRVDAEKGKMLVPPILLDILINKNVHQALHEHGLSVSRIGIHVLLFGVGMLLVYVFLFIGFNAFTDPNDVISGFVNSGIAFGVALGAHYSCAKDGDEEDVKDAVEQMQEQVMRTLNKVFEMVSKQLELAMKLFHRMQKNVDDSAQGEGSVGSGSDTSSTASGGK